MEKRILLSSTNRKIAGVCGGVAEYLNIDATIVRLVWFASIFLHGIGLLAYLIAWMVIPRGGFNTIDNH